MDRAKKQFDVTSVDPSEYEPQVVELSDRLIQDTMPHEGEPTASGGNQKENHPQGEGGGGMCSSGESVEDLKKDENSALASKNARWLSKLQKLRQQFTTPPTD